MPPKKTVKSKTRANKKVAAKKESTVSKQEQTASKKPSKTQAASLKGAELYQYAQEAAYYLAEKDGFAADPAHYWLEAQRELGLDSM